MTTILPRRGTAAEWTAANPVLAMGEEGYETDTTRWKRGDGVTAWTALAYYQPAWTELTGRDDGVKIATGGIVPIERFDPETDFVAALDAAIAEAEATGGEVVFHTARDYVTHSAGIFTDRDVRIDFRNARLIRPITPTDFTPLTFNYTHSTPQPVTAITYELLNQGWPMPVNSYVSRIDIASTVGWEVGDYAVIVGDDPIPGANPARAVQRDADRFRVVKVDANSIYAGRPIRADLTTNVRVARMTQKDCVIKNLRITDAPGWPTSRNDSFIVVNGAVKPRLENFTSRDMATRSFTYRGCALGVINGLNTLNGRTDAVIDAHGYGMILVSCNDFTVSNLSGEFTRHVITTGAAQAVPAGDADLTKYGSSYGHRIVGGSAHDTGHSAFDFHEEASDCVIDSCFVGWNHREPDGTSAAFQLRGRDNEITNCRSIGGGGIRASSYDGGGRFRISNYTHTTVLRTVGPNGYGLYAEAESDATERCVIDVSDTTFIDRDCVTVPVKLNKVVLRGEDLTVIAKRSDGNTLTVFELTDSQVELDTVVIDVSGTTGSVTMFRCLDSTSSVRIKKLIVRTSGITGWYVGTLTSLDGSITIGELNYDYIPGSSIISNVGAAGTAWVDHIVWGARTLNDSFSARGNADVTITNLSDGFQHFTNTLTAARTVNEPTVVRRHPGWKITYIRQTSADGAFPINIGTDALSTAGTWLTRMWTGTAWVTIGKGVTT